jgi:hypothetical protein
MDQDRRMPRQFSFSPTNENNALHLTVGSPSIGRIGSGNTLLAAMGGNNVTANRDFEIYLLSFANTPDYSASLRRLNRQADSLGLFSGRRIYSDKDLDPTFRAEFGEYLQSGVRGFGYWVWKPFLILEYLKALPDDSILLYVDAGCHLNPKGADRLIDYCEIAAQHPTNILHFELNSDHSLSRWTKESCLEHFNIKPGDRLRDEPQVWAGAMVIKNSPTSRDFVLRWLAPFREDWNLVDDSPSSTPNHPLFVEHRHDQSILSILAYRDGTARLSHSEQYPKKEPGHPIDWSQVSSFPIHARRELSRYRWQPVMWSTKAALRQKAKIAKRRILGADQSILSRFDWMWRRQRNP